MSDFVDNHEDALTELFEDQSDYGDDSDALDTFLAHLDNNGVDSLDEAEGYISGFDDNYRGTAESVESFTEELISEIYSEAIEGLPDVLQGCIDWESVWDRNLIYDVDFYDLGPKGYGFVWVH